MMQNRIRITLLLTAGFFMTVALSPGAAFADDPPESDSLVTWHFEEPSEVIAPERTSGFWYPERAFLEAVDSLSYSGQYSIAVTYDSTALGGSQEDNFRMSFDNVHNIGIKPQQTLHARIFVPEEAADKISQVILYDMWNRAEHGGTGFHYVPTIYNVSDDVTPGEWVTLTHLIDRDVTKETLSRIGIRVNIDTEYTGEAPMVFVDFITTDPDAQPLGDTSDPDPEPDPDPEFDTHLTWHFENPSAVISAERQSGYWYPDRAFLEAVDTNSYSGLNSIAVSYDPAALGESNEDNFRMSYDNISQIGIVPQHTLHFRVFVPEEAADKIERIDLYDMWNRGEHGGSGFDMARTRYDMGEITPGEWVTLTHLIDRDVTKEDLRRMGIVVLIDTEYTGEPPMILVDFISTDPDAELQPRLSPPRNVTGTNVTAATVDLVWDPPTGNDEVAEYVIYQGGIGNFELEDYEEIGRTADTTFSVTGLNEHTYYYFRITAITPGGMVTGASEIGWIQTGRFETHLSWHFEIPSEVISAERQSGYWYPERAFFDVVDTLSYSGLNSIAVTYDSTALGESNEDNFRMSFDNISQIGIVPQHRLHFRVFVPEEAADKIERIDLYDMWNRGEHGGSGFDMTRTRYDMDEITPGEWVTLTHLIDRDVTKEDLRRMGILVLIDTEYTGEPPMIFVDFISTDPRAALQPRLSPPLNVTGTNVTATSVDLVWNTPTGTDAVAEYVIYQGGIGDFDLADYEEIGRTADTTFTVTELNEKTYYYFRITAKNTEGLVTGPSEIGWIQTITGSDDLEDIPLVFKLKANYPNPFNPSTNIVYQIPVETEVSLRVYNIMGQLVSTLVDNVQQQPGEYTVTFDASGVASGVYLYRIEAGDFRQIKQMMLIK